jgi:SSS family solute:Na+ symporter
LLATPAEEARVSKLTSLVVKGGAVLVIIAIDPQFSMDLQLIGGVIVLQTLPSIVLGLYTRWFHRWALLAGWAAGLVAGALMLYNTPNPLTGKQHFGGAQYALSKFGLDSKVTVYTGVIALTVNLVVAVVGTLVLGAARRCRRRHDARWRLSRRGRRPGRRPGARLGGAPGAGVGCMGRDGPFPPPRRPVGLR